MALTELGTCWIAPVRAAIPCAIRSSGTACALAVAVTSPSASSVIVDWPSRIVPRYRFVLPTTYVSSRVARSTPSTSTPVAIGSSVPPWPTRRVPANRRTRATTSCDVIPAGLSTTTMPPLLTVAHLMRSDRGAVPRPPAQPLTHDRALRPRDAEQGQHRPHAADP